MTRPFTFFMAAAALVALPAIAVGHTGNEPLGAVRWSADADDRSDDRIQISFETGSREKGRRNQWSQGYAPADVPGLTHAALRGSGTPVRFVLSREAGRLDCTGTAASGRGLGTCSFAPDAAFLNRLASAGIGRPTEKQSYALALGNVGSDVIDELNRHGYARPDVDALVSMGIHGATAAYVRDIASAGYRLGTAAGLVKFRIFKIDSRYIADMAAIGPQFRQLSAEDLVQFKIFKVKPELVAAFARLGYKNLNSKELVSMSIHGVTPEYVTQMAALGYGNLPARDLVAMRIHGVTPDYVRELKAQGIAPLAANQLVKLRMAGIRPGQR